MTSIEEDNVTVTEPPVEPAAMSREPVSGANCTPSLYRNTTAVEEVVALLHDSVMGVLGGTSGSVPATLPVLPAAKEVVPTCTTGAAMAAALGGLTRMVADSTVNSGVAVVDVDCRRRRAARTYTSMITFADVATVPVGAEQSTVAKPADSGTRTAVAAAVVKVTPSVDHLQDTEAS